MKAHGASIRGMQRGTAARECGTRMEREVKERSVGGERLQIGMRKKLVGL